MKSIARRSVPVKPALAVFEELAVKLVSLLTESDLDMVGYALYILLQLFHLSKQPDQIQSAIKSEFFSRGDETFFADAHRLLIEGRAHLTREGNERTSPHTQIFFS